jgi:hypothetical protein
MTRRGFYAFSLTVLMSLGFLQTHPNIRVILSDLTAADLTALEKRLEELGHAIRKEIGVPKASKVSQCKLIAFGSKPCGGPSAYEVYSAEASNEFRLKGLVNQYNNLDRKLNEEKRAFSDCMFVEKPQVTLADGICRIKGHYP